MSVFMIACPCCQSVFPLEAALNDLAAREAVAEAFRLTTFGDLLLGYLNLFKPPKRVLAMARATRLLNELLPMIRAAKVEHKGRIWAAPRDYWQQALGEMMGRRDTLILPLKGHGYLIAIVAGYSNKAEAMQEAKREDQRAGRTPVGAPPPQPSPDGRGSETRPRSAMPEHVREALKQTSTTTRREP